MSDCTSTSPTKKPRIITNENNAVINATQSKNTHNVDEIWYEGLVVNQQCDINVLLLASSSIYMDPSNDHINSLISKHKFVKPYFGITHIACVSRIHKSKRDDFNISRYLTSPYFCRIDKLITIKPDVCKVINAHLTDRIENYFWNANNTTTNLIEQIIFANQDIRNEFNQWKHKYDKYNADGYSFKLNYVTRYISNVCLFDVTHI